MPWSANEEAIVQNSEIGFHAKSTERNKNDNSFSSASQTSKAIIMYLDIWNWDVWSFNDENFLKISFYIKTEILNLLTTDSPPKKDPLWMIQVDNM